MPRRKHPDEMHSVPRIKIHKDGRATLAGLSYHDLRSLITCASLENYQSLERLRKEGPRHPDDQSYLDNQRKVLEATQKAMEQAIHDTWPKRSTPLTKAERLAAVKAERKERQLLDSIIDEIIAERRSKNPLRALKRLVDDPG